MNPRCHRPAGTVWSPGALMSLRLGLLLSLGSVDLLLQLFILLLEKAHLFFVHPFIFQAFFTHLLHLRMECLDYCDLLFCDPIVVDYVPC